MTDHVTIIEIDHGFDRLMELASQAPREGRISIKGKAVDEELDPDNPGTQLRRPLDSHSKEIVQDLVQAGIAELEGQAQGGAQIVANQWAPKLKREAKRNSETG